MTTAAYSQGVTSFVFSKSRLLLPGARKLGSGSAPRAHTSTLSITWTTPLVP